MFSIHVGRRTAVSRAECDRLIDPFGFIATVSSL